MVDKYIFHEPTKYSFKNQDGHDGKIFGTNSQKSQHLIIEYQDRLTVSLTQNKVEFSYYVIEGKGYFVIDGHKNQVKKGDLIVIPPKTKYTFGGKLKMLLINTPPWSPEQQKTEPISGGV